jgi:predicted DNA-binding protein
MASSVTKSVAARIPIELYYQLKDLAQFDDLTMSDYLTKIINNHINSNLDRVKAIGEVKDSVKPSLAKYLILIPEAMERYKKGQEELHQKNKHK